MAANSESRHGADMSRQVGRMRDWNSVAALGGYLGIAGAGELASRGSNAPASGRLLKPVDSAAAILAEKMSPEEIGVLLEVLRDTDYDSLAAGDGDRSSVLSADVYRRFAAAPTDGDGLLPYEEFDRHFREYLRRFRTTFRALLYMTGVRKEIISLEHPAVKESVREIGSLPCRTFGEMKPGEVRHSHFTASLSRYVQALLDRHAKGLIGQDDHKEILETLDRISAYPGYYRLVEQKKKVEATRPLVSAISALRPAAAGDQEKMDLLAALGILLFNVFPSRGMIRFITAHRPGRGNRYLLYEHYALLALNYLLMGKRTAAAGYCAKAYEAAPAMDMKAYARMLEGCIALEQQDHRNAVRSLEYALELADDRNQRSLVGFYLGIVRFEAGDVGMALNCFREARAGAECDTDAMSACSNIGTCHMLLGDMGQALHAFEEAASIGTYSGRGSVKQVRSVAAGNAGIVYMSMLEYDLAKDCFTKALRDARQTGDARRVADQLMNIGLTCKAMGDYASAATHFIAALNYAYTIDYLEGVLYARDQISQALALQGKHDDEDGIYRDIARRHPGIRSLLSRRFF